MAPGESKREQERRAWVARLEGFKDASEAYERRLAAAQQTVEERQAVQLSFAAYRRAHREEDVRMGRRSPGLSIAMHQIMWARWAEVAVEHELTARRAFAEIVQGDSDVLLRELRASLVAVTASAHTIEAVFGDIKYLIPEQLRRASRQLFLWYAFREVVPRSVGFEVGSSPERLT